MRKWIDSARDRNYWKALVNVALKLRDSKSMDFTSYITEVSLISPFHEKWGLNQGIKRRDCKSN